MQGLKWKNFKIQGLKVHLHLQSFVEYHALAQLFLMANHYCDVFYIQNTKTFFILETIYKDLDKSHLLSRFLWLTTNVMSYIQNTKTFFFWRKSHFRPYIFRRFPLWSLDFIFTAFSPYPEKRFSFLSLPLHQRRKMHT